MIFFSYKAYKDEEEFFTESVKVTNEDTRVEAVSKSVFYSLRSSSKIHYCPKVSL